MRPLLALLFAMTSAPASADVVSARPQAVVLTLYHTDGLETSDLIHPNYSAEIRSEGLAFVTETRIVDLPAGPSVIRFKEVASTMVPQSAEIQGLPAGVLERNFDYDLLSPGSLLAKSVGETVHFVRTNPKTGARSDEVAIVRSGPRGVVLQKRGGGIEAFQCSGLPEKLVFGAIPAGLSDTPTLSVRTRAPRAGRYTIKISYLATGLNWNADYVARVSRDGKSIDLSGWITLANFGSTGFGKVPVEVVAGSLNTTGDDVPVQPAAPGFSAGCWPTDIDWASHRHPPAPPPPPPSPAVVTDMARASTVETVVVTAEIVARTLGDYKLYPLPERTTVAAQQTKQVQFLDRRNVRFEKVYLFESASDQESEFGQDPAQIVYRFRNRKDAGLGKPLPAGNVAVMDTTLRDIPVFVGQSSVADTSEGLPFDVTTGTSPDVMVSHEKAKSETDNGHDRDTIAIAVDNPKPVAIHFLYRALDDLGDVRIASESRPHTMDKGHPAWALEVPAGGHAELEYVVEHHN